MSLVISSKGNDVAAWRPAGNFALLFRQALLDKTAVLTSSQAEALFLGVGQELEQRAAKHDAALAGIGRLMAEASTVAEPARLGELIRDFYTACYDMFGHHRSAPAFYRFSGEFLGAVARSALGCAMGRLDLTAERLPPLTLIALGPAGRHEFSPFCNLQLLLVYGEGIPVPAELGQVLHEVLEAAGLRPDTTITPRNPDWCGTLGQWRQRLMTGLAQGEPAELIDLLRLSDQAALVPASGLDGEFRDLCLTLLGKSRATVAFQVARVLGLTNGVGIMGGLRLERNGPHHGLFALFDHALLPLTASVTTLSLIEGGVAVETTQRIRELLAKRKLNVETAEHLLVAWHTLNELRLARERDLFPRRDERSSLHLDPETLPDADTERLRDALETVHYLQRHVAISFSGWEEQTAC